MQSQNRLFDDFVKMMNGAAGTLAGMGREAQDNLRERFREGVAGMDFISREEFEAAKAIAIAAKEENALLKARIEALEARIGAQTASAKAPRARKTVGKSGPDA